MNFSTSALAVLIAAVFGGGAVTVAIINAVVGRGSRRADIADKVTEATDRIFNRMDKDYAKIEDKCNRCEARLNVTERNLADSEDDVRRMKAALRAVIRVLDANDPTGIDEAITAARQLI